MGKNNWLKNKLETPQKQFKEEMKQNNEVSSLRGKQRRAHFAAPSHLRRKLMSAHLSEELRKKHNVRAVPVRKDDEVIIVRGTYKGHKGKVTQVYRRRWCIYVEKLSKTKANGAPFQIPIHPSKVFITKLKTNRDRTDLLKRKAARVTGKGKGEKYTGKDVAMGGVDQEGTSILLITWVF
eukprot:TRINITY_DN1039_c0_g1_i1.p1 TRINITY_DN1039_c0_g1~~TRINITY_DN1039_c0_g1_i1.p1  ORF type:complete len:180 (+),score=57.35 TRINITY_DN1039_c0_g1_i1:162-701(+)